MLDKNKIEVLKNQGICPTCYNNEHGGVYDDFSDRLVYENEFFYCFFRNFSTFSRSYNNIGKAALQ